MKSSNSEVSVPQRFTHHGKLTGEKPTREFAEITIPMPWGHISGKWFGPQNVRPIVGLHGWQDNAGTFDTLAPLLSSNVAFLSIDLPGHGLSSRLPKGYYSNAGDHLVVITMIMDRYRWDKISIIGHSMSAVLAFVFAALFPEKVDMIICIDALKPLQKSFEESMSIMETNIEQFIKEDSRNRNEEEPPSYTYDELIERLYQGTFHSINKKNCKYMLARNIQKSEIYPEKYFICRDRRVLFYNYNIFSQELCVEMAKRITTAHLFIKASDSSYFEDKEYFDEVFAVLSQKPNFKYIEASGTHHLHLNNPEDIIDVINDFIEKNGPTPDEKKPSKL